MGFVVLLGLQKKVGDITICSAKMWWDLVGTFLVVVFFPLIIKMNRRLIKNENN